MCTDSYSFDRSHFNRTEEEMMNTTCSAHVVIQSFCVPVMKLVLLCCMCCFTLCLFPEIWLTNKLSDLSLKILVLCSINKWIQTAI